MNNILITGGAGFVGSNAAIYYAKKGWNVKILDNLSRAKLLGSDDKTSMLNWNFLSKFPNVELIKGTVADYSTCSSASSGCDVILHTAAQTSVISSVRDPRSDFESNCLGTFNILEAARQNDVNTLLFCSSNKVYGDNVNKLKVIEEAKRYNFEFGAQISEGFETNLCEHTPYGCSKLSGDVYVQDYGHVYGLKTGVFRMSCTYGPRQFGVEEHGWLAWLAIANLLKKPITIYGDGKQVRDVLYVSDLIDAYDKFIHSKLKNEVFNIGGGAQNTISLLELLDYLQDLTGNASILSYADWRISDQKVFIADTSKVQAKLGWKALISPKVGVESLVNWISNNKGVF